MTEEGRLRTCDICGATIFSKLIKVENTDGGMGDEIKQYEENDTGWESIQIPCCNGDEIVGKFHDLCPECLYRYYELTRNFIYERGCAEDDQSS